jgi:hypothetical protein
MNSVVAQELSYVKSVYSHPTYRYSRILPQNGSQNPVLSNGSTTTVSFDLPAQTLNLGKSRLGFNMLITPANNANNAVIQADPWSLFSRVYITCRSGLILQDVNDVPNYSKMTSCIATSNSEYEGRGGGIATITGDAASYTSYVNTAASQVDPIVGIQKCRTLLAGNVMAANASCLPFEETRYLIRGMPPAANAAVPLAVTYSIPLNTLRHTLMAVDKSIYFGQIITVNFVFAATSQWSWEAAVMANPIVLANVPAMSNLSLMLALECNPAVVDGLTTKVNSSDGFQLAIGFPLLQKTTMGAAGIASSTFRISRGMGSNILRQYISVFQPGVQLNTALNNANTIANGVYFTSAFYQTTDGYRDTEFDCQASQNTDWLLNRDLFTGTPVRNHNVWLNNYTWMTDWSGQKPSQADDSIICGLSLEGAERSLGTFATLSGAAVLYQYIIVQRQLVIQGPNILCV